MVGKNCCGTVVFGFIAALLSFWGVVSWKRNKM